MRIGKADPLGGNLVDVRRGNLAIAVIALDIPVPKIVSKNEDDMGRPVCSCAHQQEHMIQ